MADEHHLLPNETVISGPFHLFDGSFIIEFLEPNPSRNATVLMRATYKHDHPLCKKGKLHPQSPPFHLHFDQSETFQVLSGKIGTTMTYDLVDRIWTSEDEPYEITPLVPHTFWPCPDSTEDLVVLIWAHPENIADPMDWLFFQNLLRYVSDISEKKEALNPFQIMLSQHVSATALVWFPKLHFLGALRWWIPLKLQAAFAFVARLSGMKPLMEKYTPAEEWKKFLNQK